MKAVIITKPGEVDVLEIQDIPSPPAPAADRVQVRVYAAGLNRADILQRMGRYPAPPGAPQEIPGLEFAGEVVAVGPEVRSTQAGNRVFGICGGGAQAELLNVPETHIAKIPDNLDWAEAAAVPEVFITAHDALFTRAHLSSGETLLVHAAGSGVGTAAIQLARAAGARVFGTSRTREKLERAAPFGLTESFAVESDPLQLKAAVEQWTAGRGVDVILDLVGAAYLEINLQVLGKLGRLILVGTTSGSKANLDFGLVMMKRLTLRGTVLRARANEEKATAVRLFAHQVVPLLAEKTVKPVIDRTYKLNEIKEAHARMESNENFGKLVLLME